MSMTQPALAASSGALITVDAVNAGRRLDVVVRALCADVPLSAVMRWIRTGAVRLNGRRAKQSVRLQAGDVLALPNVVATVAPPRRRPRLPPVEVAFEDEHLVVLRKPAGLACHAGTGHESDSLAARLIAYLGAADASPGHRPGLAQRLDRGVSGLVPAGKHAVALRELAAAVQSGALDKVYTAVVHGSVRRGGIVDVPLRVDDQPMGDRPRTFADPVAGKPALTSYEVVHRLRGMTVLHVRIRTGRTHQIRAHMRYIGHPLLGDARYGIADVNAELLRTHGIRQPMLHAGRLEMRHPITGEALRFEMAPPPAWDALTRRGAGPR